MSDDPIYAVISGDIVESRRYAAQGPAIRDAIKAAWRECAGAFDALDGTPAVDVFAGDSWQILLPCPAPALRVGLCMRALIKSDERLPKADTRLAIGIGTVDFVDQDSVSEGQGEAFGLSGEALDSLQDSKVRMAVRLPETWSDEGGLLDPQTTLDTMMALADAICADWTASQAAVVAGALMELDQTRIGEQLSISQPAVSQALRAARWNPIEQAADWWRTSGLQTWRCDAGGRR
jgi:hypothetical protein